MLQFCSDGYETAAEFAAFPADVEREMERRLTIPEAAERLACSDRTVRDWCKSGKIKARIVAGKYLIPEEELDRLLGRGTVTEFPPLGELVDLLHRWREQAQFLSLDQFLRRFYLGELGGKLQHCMSETQCGAEIYDAAKRHHAQASLQLGRALLPIEQEGLFHRLRQCLPDDPVWEAEDTFDLTHGAYLEAFVGWCGDIKYWLESCLALALIDELPQEDREVANTKDFLKRLKKKDANWVVFLELASLVACCDLLTLGIVELPPNPLAFNAVDKLNLLRDDAINLSTKLLGDFRLTPDGIGRIGGFFWGRLAEVKENTRELLHNLQQLQDAHNDLHDKLTALELRLYGVAE